MNDNVMPITDRRKVGRREALWFLLSGAGLLTGCQIQSGYKPTLPESCVWAKFPYTWLCIDPKEGDAVPKKETELWESIPLSKKHVDQLNKTTPLPWEKLYELSPCSLTVAPALYQWYSENQFVLTEPIERFGYQDNEPEFGDDDED